MHVATYHVNSVGHGFVHGSSTSDGAFHSRVEAGCGNPGAKNCLLYSPSSVYVGGEAIAPGSNYTCNYFFGGGGECLGQARVDFNGVFSDHRHNAHNYCG